MTKLSFLPSLQKTRHPTAGGNTTYRLTVRSNGGAYCYLGTSGDFQSTLLADAKSLKKKKEYALLKRTLVKALERFKSYCFKRIGKAFTKLQEKNDKVNIFKTV